MARLAVVRKTDHLVDNVIEVSEAHPFDPREYEQRNRKVFCVELHDEFEHAEYGWRFTGEEDVRFAPLDEKRAAECFPDEGQCTRAIELAAREFVSAPEPEPEPVAESTDALGEAIDAIALEERMNEADGFDDLDGDEDFDPLDTEPAAVEPEPAAVEPAAFEPTPEPAVADAPAPNPATDETREISEAELEKALSDEST